MNRQNTVDIHILDKDYQVSCPSEERDALLQAAKQLDERMRSIRNTGTVIGLERIAIMAALNLTYDLLKEQTNASQSTVANEDLRHLDDKLGKALKELEQTSIF